MMQRTEDIALIGMAGIYPGAPNVRAFWRNILAKVDAVTDAPASWNAARYHLDSADESTNTKTYCQRGGFIEAYAEFAPLDFGIMPSSIDGSDPGQFLALRVAREALADAGYLNRPFPRERTAVIIGRGNSPNRGLTSSGAYGEAERFFELLREVVPELPVEAVEMIARRVKDRLPAFTPDTCPGLISNVLAGRIANRLDIMGPNFLVDAACASSLVAVDAGMRELQSGRCDLALVGGAQDNTNAGVFIVFSMLGALSKRGRLRPFDRDADGTLLGEGVGMGVLKRRADAERDGDRIYALLKGVGLSSDGQGQAFLVPRLEGEVAAMRRAYAVSEVPPETIGLIEAHGTATAVGDRTEVQAMTEVFGPRQHPLPDCALGAVKSMISHTIPASGMAGLFKAALSLYHKVLPPTLCDTPNPDLGLERTGIYLNTETRPWIHGHPHPRRAGVSAFGFGGVNSHCVLEEHTPDQPPAPGLMPAWDEELVVVAAASRDALRDRACHLRDTLQVRTDLTLRDVAFTLNCPLAPDAPARLALVARSPADLLDKLNTALAALNDPACTQIADRNGVYYFDRPLAREGQLAFLLPGEGAQYAGMLADLCLHFEDVRLWFDRADRAFLQRERRPLPSQVVYPPPHLTDAERQSVDAALWDMAYALPLITAADSALYQLMLALGIRPQALAGHSTAQDLALEAAAFADTTTSQTITRAPVIEDRMLEQWVRDLVPKARLLSVGASDPARVAALATASGGRLVVAMDNCPNQVVLCGDDASIESARDTLTGEGAVCQLLPFDRGYHTPMYRPICERLEQTAGTYAGLVPKIPLYCTTTGQRLPETPAEIRRIMIDQWADPIRFRETVEAMYADGVRVFLEVGPRGNLTGFVEDTLCGRPHAAIPTNLTTRSGLAQLLHALAQLCAHGVPMTLDYLYARRSPARVDLDALTGSKPMDAPPSARMVKLKMDIPLPALDAQDRQALRACLMTALGGQAEPSAASLDRPAAAVVTGDPTLQVHVRTIKSILDMHERVLSEALARHGEAAAGAVSLVQKDEGESRNPPPRLGARLCGLT